MTLEDDVRRCCEDIEGVHNDAERVRKCCADDAKQDLSKFESKLEDFRRQAHEARQRLDSGLREGFEGLVATWREGRDRLHGHLRLIEAKSSLASARRLGKDQYYVAAERELTTALRLIQEARPLLPAKDAHLKELLEQIEPAIEDFKQESQAAAARLESVVATNERLLVELGQ